MKGKKVRSNHRENTVRRGRYKGVSIMVQRSFNQVQRRFEEVSKKAYRRFKKGSKKVQRKFKEC